MPRLSDRLPSSLKLLNYFSFRIAQRTSSWALVAHPQRVEKYYLFAEPGGETLSVFGNQQPGLMTKETLLMELAGFTDLECLAGQLDQFSGAEQLDPTPSFEQSLTVEKMALIAMDLGELKGEEGAWHELELFKKRIFKSRAGTWKIPLCLYQDRRFVQFVNTVEWERGERRYMNGRTDGFFSSNFLATSTKMFLTSSPYSWERFAEHAQAPEYFFVLGHESAGQPLFTVVQKLYEKYAFSTMAFPVTTDVREMTFVCAFLNFLWRTSGGAMTLEVNPSHYVLSYDANTQSQVSAVTYFLTQVNLEIEALFFGTQRGYWEISTSALKAFKPNVHRHITEGVTHYSIQLTNEPRLAQLFLRSIFSFLLPATKAEFHVLPV